MNNVFFKWHNSPDAVKSSIVFAIATFIVKGISFITTPIYTRIISSDEYGLVSTYSSWLAIVEVFALLGLTSAGIFNVGLKDNKDNRDQYVSVIVVLSNIVSIIVFAIIFLIKIPFADTFILPWYMILAMFIQCFFNPAQIFWITRQRYEYKYKLPFWIATLSTIIVQIITIVCVLNSDSINPGIGIGYFKVWVNTLAALIIEIPIYIMLLCKGKKAFDKNIYKSTLIFAIPLLPHYLAQHIMSNSDRIMITNMCSSSFTAIYSIVLNISMVATIIWSAINASLVPYEYDKIDNNETVKINRVVIPILVIYSIICILICLVAPEIVKILAPQEYYEGIYAVPPIAATAFASALYNIYANIEFYHKKGWWIALSTILAAGLNIGLNYWLIPKYGYLGAAYTTLVSNILLVVMHYVGYKVFHKEKIYNDNIIRIVSILTITLCIICGFTYYNIYIRHSLILLLIIIIFIKRKTIKQKILNVKGKTFNEE